MCLNLRSNCLQLLLWIIHMHHTTRAAIISGLHLMRRAGLQNAICSLNATFSCASPARCCTNLWKRPAHKHIRQFTTLLRHPQRLPFQPKVSMATGKSEHNHHLTLTFTFYRSRTTARSLAGTTNISAMLTLTCNPHARRAVRTCWTSPPAEDLIPPSSSCKPQSSLPPLPNVPADIDYGVPARSFRRPRVGWIFPR